MKQLLTTFVFGTLMTFLFLGGFVQVKKQREVTLTLEISRPDDSIKVHVVDYWGLYTPIPEQIELKKKAEFELVELTEKCSSCPHQYRFLFGPTDQPIQIKNLSFTDPAFGVNTQFEMAQICQEIGQAEKGEVTSHQLTILPSGDNSFVEFKLHEKRSYFDYWILLKWYHYVGFVLLAFSISVLVVYRFKVELINRKLFYAGAFLLCIGIALQRPILGWFEIHRTVEKRTLTPFPKWEKNPQQYVTKFKSYLSDHFPLKFELTKTNSVIHLELFNESVKRQNVFIGKDDFWFPALLGIEEDLEGKSRFGLQELYNLRKNILERSLYLKKKGIKYYLVLCPNKHTVYPDKLPDYKQALLKEKRSDQLVKYLEGDTNLNILDLRTALIDARDSIQQDLFYKYDIHWNQLGAFIGYYNIMQTVQSDSFQEKPLELNDFELSEYYTDRADMANMFAVQDLYKRKEIGLEYKKQLPSVMNKYIGVQKMILENPEKEQKLLMFRDSYGVDLIPLLKNHFGRIVAIWDQSFDISLIEKEKPDIVIQQLVEFHVPRLFEVNTDEVQEELKSNPHLIQEKFEELLQSNKEKN